MKRKYTIYVDQYLKEKNVNITDGKDLHISIQVSEPDEEVKIDSKYDDIFNDETPGKLNFNYDDKLEDLYRIEKSINTILASDACYSDIQTHNSVINPTSEELNITITTKEDDNGIINQFHTALKDWNEGICNIKGFKYDINRDLDDIILGGNGVNGKNKSIAIIRVHKG